MELFLSVVGVEALRKPVEPSSMRFVQIPVEALSRGALDGLIEEFVTRDGTDYGTEERTLDDKKSAVVRQLDRGEVVIVFDPETQTSNIIIKDDLRLRGSTQSR